MELFANIKKKILALDTDQMITDYVAKNQEELTGDQISQWDEGLSNEGKKFVNKQTGKATYTKAYKRLKEKRGIPANVINLKLENDFRRLTTVFTVNREVLYTSLDKKKDSVECQYDDVLGPTDENLNKLKEGLKEFIGNEIRNELQNT